MAAGITEILADAADQDVILAGGIDRHWKIIPDPIVHDPDARRIRQDRAHLLRRNRLFAFEGDGLAVRAQHGNTHAGYADSDPVVVKDLSGLPDHLGFLLIVSGLG